MTEPTDDEKLDYIADMAAQLAAVSGTRFPFLSALLRTAASVAHERTDDAPDDDCPTCGA